MSNPISTAASAFWSSVVRTLFPLIVGAVIAFLVKSGIPTAGDFTETLTTLLTVAFSGVYYIAVRLLETYVTPKFGWLLGLAKTVTYASSTVPAAPIGQVTGLTGTPTVTPAPPAE
jgi:hypothetical protein